MWFRRKKKKPKKSPVKVAASKSVDRSKALFSRQQSMEDLREDGDPRWRREAWTDLREAAECEEGLDRLAKAVKAMLRRR